MTIIMFRYTREISKMKTCTVWKSTLHTKCYGYCKVHTAHQMLWLLQVIINSNTRQLKCLPSAIAIFHLANI